MKMLKSKNSKAIWALVFGLIVILTLTGYSEAYTVASFADPTLNAGTPLLEINLVTNLVTGGWDDSQTNLDLEVFGITYNDAFFTMTDLTYLGDITGGQTSGGTIEFFADGQNTSTAPLIQIDFDSAQISLLELAGMDELFANGVVITGSAISGILSEESFSFNLANQVAIGGDLANGFTATASFSSSAIPEPSTMALLGIGWLVNASIRRKNKFLPGGKQNENIKK